MKFRKNKRKNIILSLLILLLSLSIGYAFLTQDLSIVGLYKIRDNSWNVYFDHLVLNSKNVELSTGDVEATINSETKTNISYTVTLKKPGDFYEFTVDVVNDGSLDAMVGSVTNQLNGVEIDAEHPLPAYLKYSVTYFDGKDILSNHLLKANSKEIYRIRLEYRLDIDSEDLPDTDVSLTLDFGVTYVQKDGSFIDRDFKLYNVLKKAASQGKYAKEYLAAHHDSPSGRGTEKIYYWYSEKDSEGTAILDKNNVIFANHCWQMIRTTDTGGVKMIYNGEVENNQCLNTRGNHVGYSSIINKSLNGDYYYGTDYEYNKETKKFSLSGNVGHSTWSLNTSSSLIGKYTCALSSETGTCSTLYLIESYKDDTTAVAIQMNSNSNYSQFGSLPYNLAVDSIAYAGYMYNSVYPSQIINASSLGKIEVEVESITQEDYSLVSNDTTYPFTFDSDTKMWTSTMKQHSTSASIIFNVSANGDYVLNYSISSESGYDKAYFYKNGTELKNDSGVNQSSIVLNGLTTSDQIEVKYSKDSTSSSGTDSVSFMMGIATGDISDNRFLFGKSVEYSNGTYQLVDSIKAEYNDNIGSYHYTCFNTSGSCQIVSYLYYKSSNRLYYIELENGKLINNAIDDMLNADNVNQTDSTIKVGVENWYKKNIYNHYDNYIEDVVYCNDRSINSLGSWSPTYSSLNSYLYFNAYSSSTNDLNCENVTDQFSISNEKAKLKYKVGLMTMQEEKLLKNNKSRVSGSNYWLLEPNYFSNGSSYHGSISSSGAISYYASSNNFGVRPVISLVDGVEYYDGDGSMANPYRVYDYIYLSDKEISLEPGDTHNLTFSSSTSGDVIWESSNPSVATVDSNGVVTAVNYGSAVITVKVGNALAMANVVVESIPTIKVGEYFRMVPDASSYTLSSSVTGYRVDDVPTDQTITPNELTLWRVINTNIDGTMEAVSEYVSSESVHFGGYTGYANFIGGLQLVAAQYAKAGYTVATRMMGYDGQTEFITDTSSFNGSSSDVPGTTETPRLMTGEGEEYGGGILGDTLYLRDIQLVGNVYKSDTSTYGKNGLGAYKMGSVYNKDAYWLASRDYNYYDEYYTDFQLRLIGTSNDTLYSVIIWKYTFPNSWTETSHPGFPFRPIITLKSGIQTVSGTGTMEDPFILA